MNEKLPTYGGQAVIEGVMMRGARSVAIAMRAPTQEIVVHTEPLPNLYRSRITKIPFLRGLTALWDALGLGMNALTRSANMQTGEDEKLEGPALYATLGTSFLIGIGLFFLAPAVVGHWIQGWIAGPGEVTASAAWWGNVAEGVVRLLILLAYLALVGRIPEIKRVFSYHGAEHKTINAFEDGAELKPEVVAGYSLEHPRCGTAFLLTVVVFSILLFSLLGPLPVAWRLISRVALLPLLAGAAYEYIRWTAMNLENPLVRLLVKPNLALQHLTTREPDLHMLEVSIAAFQAMRRQENPELAREEAPLSL